MKLNVSLGIDWIYRLKKIILAVYLQELYKSDRNNIQVWLRKYSYKFYHSIIHVIEVHWN